jgi:ribosomal-protein-alanine N-acetyltransferase
VTTLRTARLILRPFEPADIPAYAAIRAQDAVARHLPGGVARARLAQSVAETLVPAFAQAWRDPGYGPWAVVEAASGRLLGHAGLRRLPELGGETEILYALDGAAWGRGYATEAALAARDFGFGALKLPRLIALAVPENAASIRVIEKLGLRYDRDVDFAGLTARLYAGGPRAQDP